MKTLIKIIYILWATPFWMLGVVWFTIARSFMSANESIDLFRNWVSIKKD